MSDTEPTCEVCGFLADQRPDVCEHGSLRRSCEVCELQAERDSVRSDYRLLYRDFKALAGAVVGLCYEQDWEAWPLEQLIKQAARARVEDEAAEAREDRLEACERERDEARALLREKDKRCAGVNTPIPCGKCWSCRVRAFLACSTEATR